MNVAEAIFETIRFSLPEDLGGESGLVRTGPADEDGITRIELAAFAEIEINLVAPAARSNPACISVMPDIDPTKLADCGSDASSLQALKFDPESLEMSLLRRGRKLFTFREKTRVAPETSRAVVYVPYTGSVRIAVVEPDFQTAVARCDVVRGEVRMIELPLFLPPLASGVLVDEHDRPMPGKTVAIRFHSTFAGDELVPRSDDDAKECGVVILSDRSDPSRAAVYLKRVVVTDAEGRFQSPLSYSDRVAVWSFDAEHGVAYCDAMLGSRTADWRNIRLKYSGLPNRSLATPVHLATGDPARERTYFVCETPGHPFQFEYPDLKTDAEGNLDTRYLKIGQRYGMVEIGGSGRTSEFVFQPGMTILR